MNLPVFSIQYFGHLHFYHEMIQFPAILMEHYEYYIKQTYRNRTYILSANGILPLIIPVKHRSHKEFICEKEICFKEKWNKKHYTAIVSAYKKSPYFEHYADILLQPLLHPVDTNLINFNLHLIQKVLSILDVQINIQPTTQYQQTYTKDYRLYFDNTPPLPTTLNEPYIQVFSDRLPFQKNLSILDIIFNLGPQSINYLRKYSLTYL